MSNTKETTSNKYFPLVNAIAKLLKLDDGGVINRFFEKEVKKLRTNIKTLKANIAQLELGNETAMDEIADSLEDARIALQEAYLAVTVEKVKNNASIEDFRAEYWDNIEYRKDDVARLEKKEVNVQKKHDEAVEAIQKQVDAFQMNIDAITK